MLLSPENMETYRWVRSEKHRPYPSAETCTITLANHFVTPVTASPTVTFQSIVFSDIGGITGSPHTGGQAEKDRLIKLIQAKESIAKEETKKIQVQQAELENCLSRLYSMRLPIEKDPGKS